MSESKHSVGRAILIGVVTSLVVGAIIYGLRVMAAKRKLPQHLVTKDKQPDGIAYDRFHIDQHDKPVIRV